jgi:hypothetical protein
MQGLLLTHEPESLPVEAAEKRLQGTPTTF